MACCIYGFSRDAQLQATVNTSCWHKAFVLYMMAGQVIDDGDHQWPAMAELCVLKPNS
jgi:hypothetical protein